MTIKKIGIIGLGYIGLPTFVAISKTNQYKVVGYDIDPHKISLIERHISPIEDSDVSSYIKEHELNASSDPNILKNSQVFIICVPTPILHDYTPDYSFVISAAETVSKFLKRGSHVVLESTVNPGTCREIILPILAKYSKLKPGKDFNLAHCPERINPGDTRWNIYNINRNIGSINELPRKNLRGIPNGQVLLSASSSKPADEVFARKNKKLNKQISAFYRTFIPAEIHEVSSLEIAEATKIVENAFRDINIAYVNELAKSFDAMNIDLHETLHAASN